MDTNTRDAATTAANPQQHGGSGARGTTAPSEGRPLRLVLPPTERLPDPIPSAQMTLVEQLTEWARMRIDERVFRAGMRMPSIRQLAQEKGISRFTVVEAYERLVALGYLESRRGSGFYVRERTPAVPAAPVSSNAAEARNIDVTWLLRSMFHTAEAHKAPGLGFLPNEWLDGELIASALRGSSSVRSAGPSNCAATVDIIASTGAGTIAIAMQEAARTQIGPTMPSEDSCAAVAGALRAAPSNATPASRTKQRAVSPPTNANAPTMNSAATP